MELDGLRPGTLFVEGYGSLQWLQGILDPVDILGVQAHQSALLGDGGKHMVEWRGFGRLGLVGQLAHHVVEGTRRRVASVHRGVKEMLPGSLQLVLAAQGVEEASRRAKIGNYSA